jgi:ubiquinone/menaquinone biosynthesis C-methylase UbiE
MRGILLNRFEFHSAIERYHTVQNPTSEEKLDLAIDYCAVRDGMKILDVGCGKGSLARRLAKRFDVQVTGLEINPTSIDQARRLAAEENLADRIQIIEGPALDFRAEPGSFNVVVCIGASSALGGFESALDWMSLKTKPGGMIAIGEVFARVLPLPDNLPSNRYPEVQSLWTTVEKIRARGLMPRGIVESSIDDWNHYHSLHWQAALDWALEHGDSPDAALMLDPEGQRCDLEIDGRLIGWAIFVARKGRFHQT